MSAGPSFVDRLSGVFSFLQAPPPEFVFEISAQGIAMSRTKPPLTHHHVLLAPGVVSPSPVKENVLDPAAFADAVRKIVPPVTGRVKRNCALILPDNAVRIAILDFEAFPAKEEERRSLLNFRLRKSVPFDIDEAAVSYFVQSGTGIANKVIVVMSPAEIIAHYEAPFRAAGLNPGLVTVSSLVMLESLPAAGSLVVAHGSTNTLTVLALKDGVVTIVRSLELTQETADPIEEISADLYPTLAYIEDQSGSRPEQLFLAGFGKDSHSSARRLSEELEIPVEPIDSPHPGLAGYLASLNLKAAAA